MATARNDGQSQSRRLYDVAPDIVIPEFLRIVAYGDYGSGKTTFSTKFCKKGNILIDSERSAHVLSNWPDLNKRTKVVPWTGITDFRAYAEDIANGYYGDKDTLILDTATSAADINMEQILATHNFNERDAPNAPCPRDYKIQESMWRIPSLAVLKLPINLIINVHERAPAMDLDKKRKLTDDEQKFRPDAANGVIKNFLRVSDFIVRLGSTKGSGERIVTIGTNPTGVAKNRANLPKQMPEEDFIKAVWKWRNGAT